MDIDPTPERVTPLLNYAASTLVNDLGAAVVTEKASELWDKVYGCGSDARYTGPRHPDYVDPHEPDASSPDYDAVFWLCVEPDVDPELVRKVQHATFPISLNGQDFIGLINVVVKKNTARLA